MVKDFNYITEVLSEHDINISINDSLNDFIKKLRYGLSKIEDDETRNVVIEDIAKVLANRPYISRKALGEMK